MKKNDKNYILLTALFCTCLVISNVLSAKTIAIGHYLILPGAVMCYPITYLITDIVGEIWGKQHSNRIVRYGFICQTAAMIIITLAAYLPTDNAEMQNAYTTLLGQNWVFVLGSLVAYLASQYLDVTIFHKVRDRYIKKHGCTKGGRWIWNNASTMTSQLVDTVIFTVIAFGFGFGWIFNNVPALINMIVGQYFVKFLIAALDTPFFYLFTRNRE